MARRMVWGKITTPAPLLQTTFGQPANILTDMLTSLPSSYIPLAALRYSHFYDHDKAIQITNKANLSNYCNLPNIQSMVLLRDPAFPQQLEASSSTVNIQTWSGRRKITALQYMKSISIGKPHFAVNFHDEIFPDAGHNRTRACAERCVQWLRECLQVYSSDTNFIPPLPNSNAKSSSSSATDLPKVSSSDTKLLAFLPCITDTELRSKTINQILDIVKKYDIMDRTTSSTVVNSFSSSSSSPIAGFVLGCLGLGESIQQRNDILQKVIAMLPPTGLRVLSGIGGSGGPVDVLAAVDQGIDLIDSDYPQTLTQYGHASTFIYRIEIFLADTTNTTSSSSSVPHKRGAITAELDGSIVDSSTNHPSKRSHTTEDDKITSSSTTFLPSRNLHSIAASDPEIKQKIQASAVQTLQLDPATKINLYDKIFAEDQHPLVADCLCFACSGTKAYEHTENGAAFVEYPVPPLRPTKDNRPLIHPGHTRSYVHHLLNTHEMLADVLLSIHNTYHYAAFFHAIRQAIEMKKFNEYRQWFLRKNHFRNSGNSEENEQEK